MTPPSNTTASTSGDLLGLGMFPSWHGSTSENFTFSQYVTKFLSILDTYLQSETVERSDVVWDEYRELTVKLARSTRKGGCRIKVRPSTKVPTNWEGFLRVGGNIDELVNLIASGIQEHNEQDKLMVSTVGEGVASDPAEMEYHHLAPYRRKQTLEFSFTLQIW